LQDFSEFQRSHASVVSSIEEHLNQGDHCILALESVVGSVSEDSPQTTLGSVIDGLRTQLDTFGRTLTNLETEVTKQAQDLKAVKCTPPPPSVTFTANTAASTDIATLQHNISSF
jgi:hypothetical protein